MKKVFKILLIVVAFILLTAIVLPFIYKDKIAGMAKDEINNSLNAKVEIADVGLSLFRNFPNFNLKLKGLCITGINEFSGDTLCNLPLLNVVIDIWSVIGGEIIDIKAIELDNPRIFAHVLKDGKANWDIAKPSAPEDTTAPAEPSTFHIGLKNVSINEGQIIYDDASMAMKLVMNDLNFKLQGDLSADLTKLHTELNAGAIDYFYEGVPFLNRIKTNFTGDIDFAMSDLRFTFLENKLALNELELAFDGFFAMPDTSFLMDMKFKALRNEFKNFLSLAPAMYTADFKDIEASGTLALDGFVKGRYNGSEMPAFGINLDVNKARFKYPSLPKAAENITINLKIDDPGDPDKTIINLSHFHAELGANPVDFTLLLKTPLSDPDFNASLSARLDLGSLKDVIPLGKSSLSGKIVSDLKFKGLMSQVEKQEFEKVQAEGNFQLAGFTFNSPDFPSPVEIPMLTLNLNPATIVLQKFEARIGKSDMNLSGKMENFFAYFLKDGTLKADFNFASTYLNLAELMPVDSAPTSKQSDTSSLSAFEIPANIDFRLKSEIKKLKYDDIEITNLSGLIRLADQKAGFSGVKMELLGGSLGMDGAYDAKTPETPEVQFRLNANNFDIPKTYTFFPTIAKLVPLGKYATGTISATFDLNSRLGSDLKPVMNSLNAAGRLKSKNISIKDSKFQKQLADGLKNQKFSTLALTDLDAAFKVTNGNLEVQPFPVKFGTSKALVSGTQNLDQSINYLAKFTVPTGELGSGANALFPTGLAGFTAKEVNFDALVTGTVMDPKVKLGLKNVLNQAFEGAKQKVEAEVKKQVEAIKESAREKADKLIAEAQKKADALKSTARQTAEVIKKQADVEAQKLLDASKKKSVIEQNLAKVAAEKLKSTARKKADSGVKEADSQADQIMTLARAEADKLLKEGK